MKELLFWKEEKDIGPTGGRMPKVAVKILVIFQVREVHFARACSETVRYHMVENSS